MLLYGGPKGPPCRRTCGVNACSRLNKTTRHTIPKAREADASRVFFLSMFEESSTRSVVKALSWRFIATLTTAGLVFAFTGRFDLAITVGVFEAVAKMFLYFVHERVWNKLKFGRKPAGRSLATSE